MTWLFSWYHIFYSLEIINAVIPNPYIFFLIAAYVSDAAAVNPNGIKALLACGLTTLFIIGVPVFSNGPKSLIWKSSYTIEFLIILY